LDHLVSQEAAAAPDCQHELDASKSGSSANQSGGGQGQTRPRSETSAGDEAKPDAERNPKEVAAEQNKVLGAKIETRTEAKTSSQQPQNWTVQFPNPDHPVSAASSQKKTSRTTAPEMAPAHHWCPLGPTHGQRRRIQRMRAQKFREDAAEKERDEHFNTIQPMFPSKQEWRVEEKADTPTPMTSDDDMDLLDDNEVPLIKDGSPPPTGIDISMVFTLPAEFRGIEEEVAQMCLGYKEAVFEKLEELSQHMKSLYIRGNIDGRPIFWVLIDGSTAVNLMSYSIFKKLGWEDDELMKTNLTLNRVGGNSMEARGVISMEFTVGSKSLATAFFVIEVHGNYSVILGRDWIHANCYIPSTLHQFLIQWIDDEVEVVHADASAYIALADATADWQHGSTQCLSGKDLTGYDFLSVFKDGFVPKSVQLASGTRLGV
jgi:hypothetical protein